MFHPCLSHSLYLSLYFSFSHPFPRKREQKRARRQMGSVQIENLLWQWRSVGHDTGSKNRKCHKFYASPLGVCTRNVNKDSLAVQNVRSVRVPQTARANAIMPSSSSHNAKQQVLNFLPIRARFATFLPPFPLLLTDYRSCVPCVGQ